MSCLKFNFFFLLFLSSSLAAQVEKFAPKECLMAKYDAAVEHKGDFWGLLKNQLTVKKDVCQIVVLDKGMLDNEWKVDVCREPIHIKAVRRGSLSVFKRSGECGASTAKASEYCESLARLMEVLENKGLIFAKGEREKLSTDHGKIYCAYLLLKNHLAEGVLFSKYEKPMDIYQAGIGKNIVESSEGAPEKTQSKEAPEKQSSEGQVKGEKKKVEAQGRF